MPDLLIELFSEEIPARMQARAGEDLRARLTDALVEAGLTYAGAAAFTTPRRLVLTVQGLLAQSPTTREERKGPRVDAPEKAIEGFLRGTGLSRDALEIREEKKGAVYFAVIERPGRPAAEIVAEELEKLIRTFPWPKSMRWGEGSLRWVRPLHSILCILTDDAGEASVVPLEVEGIAAGASTRGHRFMAPEVFEVTSFDDYRAKLKRAHVMLDAAERAAHIRQAAGNLAFASGFEMVEDEGLLAEVAGLVEWPVVLMGRIGAAFLDLPPEVLQTSMKEHQKFFSVRNPKSGQIERFITVANIETPDDGATILAGNEKVLAARLSDAKFFWENDLRVVREKGLEGMGAGLAEVTFHNKLGSQAARVARITALAREIAPLVGAEPEEAALAASVCKADLQSEMVGEFPELQGLMGRYYAEAGGLSPAVADACEAHYHPLGPSDSVPSAPVSVAVALADKIDTLTGFWAIDEKPTGSKDPYALRRAALGVIRLVLENQLFLHIQDLLRFSAEHYHLKWAEPASIVKWCKRVPLRENADIEKFAPHVVISVSSDWSRQRDDESFSVVYLLREGGSKEDNEQEVSFSSLKRVLADFCGPFPRALTVSAILSSLVPFFHDRLKVHLRDQGIRHDVIDACLAMPGNDDLTLLVRRAEALSAFLQTEDGENLVQGFRRANNILSQAEEKDGVEYSFGAEVTLAETDEERALFAALERAEPQIAAAMKAEDFAAAMAAMAGLRAPIDAFFDAVQINTENAILRRNRLNLLSQIRDICLQVADLSRLEG